MPLTPGTRLGVYEITGQLGEGGMGQVYRATDAKLKRQVAIKILPPALRADADRLARFQREAEILASLNHPNIAGIYGLEESRSITAIVMELVEGEDLSEGIRRGPIPLDEALHIARQIADALETAHEQGIIHRDLKPANIKVRSDGTVKVLDFGLAKALDPLASTTAGAAMTNSPTITSPAVMTGVGVVLGTAAYMSPEQARGRAVDRRADIWAFGCVLYEMLTGRRTFDAEDVSLTLAEVIKSEPDWSRLPTLPSPIGLCLRRCLKKDPRVRLRDIGEARVALDGLIDAPIDDVSHVSSSVERPARPWSLQVAIASAIVAGLLTVWFRPVRESAAPGVVRFEIHAAAGAKITPGTPAVSPDARTLAYVMTDAGGTARVFLRRLDSTASRVLPGTEGAAHPFWSPDGRSLAFWSDGALRRIDVAGGSARTLATTIGPWHGSWSQSGDVLFLVDGLPSRIAADGGTPAPIVTLDPQRDEKRAGHPVFLPDGNRFLTRVDHEKSGSVIHLGSLASPERKLVLADIESAVIVAPTPADQTYLLYLRGDSLVAHEFNLISGEVRGTPRVIAENIGRVGNPAVLPTVGASPAGAIAYQTGTTAASLAVNWLNRSGEEAADVTVDLADLTRPSDPTLSPDGRLLLLSGFARGSQDRDLWITDLTRGVTSRLTRGGALGTAWSPDGTRVAFIRNARLYAKNADGAGDEMVISDADGGVPISWSPDGKNLLLAMPRGTLSLWPLAGGTGIRVASSAEGQLSPDGRSIAYVSNESGRSEIYLQPLPPSTGRVKVSAGGGRLPRWSRESGELFFIANGAMMAVDARPGQPLGVARSLFPFNAAYANIDYDVTADGQRFIITGLRREDLPDSPITVVLNWWAELAKPD